MAGQPDGAGAGGDGHRREQTELQPQGSQHQPPTLPGSGQHAARVEAERRTGRSRATQHDRRQGHRTSCLRDQRADRRAGQAQTHRVDEHPVEGDVDEVDGDRDHQWGPGVLQATQDAGRGQADEQEGQPEAGDPQVADAHLVHQWARAVEANEVRCDQFDRHDENEPEPQAEHHPVDATSQRALPVAGAEQAGDHACRPVGQEDAQPQHDGDDLTGDAERSEFGSAQVSDEGRVGHQQQGFADQGREGGDGECGNLTSKPRACNGPRSCRGAQVGTHPPNARTQ